MNKKQSIWHLLILWQMVCSAAQEVWQTITNAAVAAFTAVTAPVRALVIDITPVQDLHGYTNPWPAGGGVNQFYPATDGTASGVYNGVTCTRNNDGSFSFDGTAEASTWFNFGKVTLPAGTWTMSFVQTGTKENGNISLGANAGVFVSYPYTTTYPRTETAAEETTGNFGINFPSGCKLTNYTLWLQIEAGSSPTAWSPYSNVCPISGWAGAKVWVEPTHDTTANPTVTIDLDGTRYGGTLNVTTGVLTVTDGNIAAYNGETLPGAWISSMDVYAEGATPTTGAQVVYQLAAPQVIQLTPTEVTTLLGQNNVWTDTGNINTITYRES